MAFGLLANYPRRRYQPRKSGYVLDTHRRDRLSPGGHPAKTHSNNQTTEARRPLASRCASVEQRASETRSAPTRTPARGKPREVGVGPKFRGGSRPWMTPAKLKKSSRSSTSRTWRSTAKGSCSTTKAEEHHTERTEEEERSGRRRRKPEAVMRRQKW